MNLIVGANGLIGRALCERLDLDGIPYLATSRVAAKNRLPFDLTTDPASWRLPPGISTAFLCAAETRLQACEDEPQQTALINVERTTELARQLVSGGAFVVYPSTNLVFDGSRRVFHPGDPVSPHTEYGRQKARAEARLSEFSGHVAIARLSKVLHSRMELFGGWKANLLRGEVVRPFGNLFISPLSPEFVARALQAIAQRKLAGITQLSGDRQISYSDCALALASALGLDDGLVQPTDAPQGMPRSAALDPERATRELGLPPPNVAQTLAELFHSFA